MILGYYALTEITVDTDIDLFYNGPNKAASTLTTDGRFRLHILPDNVKTILIVSRDFAGVQTERESLYTLKEALEIKFVSPLKIDVDATSGSGTLIPPDPNASLKPIKSKSKKLKRLLDK
jgi:hypothetical protein